MYEEWVVGLTYEMCTEWYVMQIYEMFVNKCTKNCTSFKYKESAKNGLAYRSNLRNVRQMVYVSTLGKVWKIVLHLNLRKVRRMAYR